jgi:hypothetical protein
MKSKKKIIRNILGMAVIILFGLTILVPKLTNYLQIFALLSLAFWAYFSSEVNKEYRKAEDDQKNITPKSHENRN